MATAFQYDAFQHDAFQTDAPQYDTFEPCAFQDDAFQKVACAAPAGQIPVETWKTLNLSVRAADMTILGVGPVHMTVQDFYRSLRSIIAVDDKEQIP